MKVDIYDHFYDNEMIDLLMANGLPGDLILTLPENGIIVYDPDDLNDRNNPIIAAGFIRKIEGGFGLIDGYITDPIYSSHVRNQALNKLTDELIRMADHLKITSLIASTTFESILTRSTEFGFRHLSDHKMIIKNLHPGPKLWGFICRG